jgi:hypothetical protein
VAGFEKALLDQESDGAPDGHPRHAVLLGQQPFGGKPLSRCIFSALDIVENIVFNLIVERNRIVLVDHGTNPADIFLNEEVDCLIIGKPVFEPSRSDPLMPRHAPVPLEI